VFVILNKVKNLMRPIHYTTQILRLSPQDDIATQSLTDRGEGAYCCPLTLTLSRQGRQGRENPPPCVVQQAKYFLGLGLIVLLILGLATSCDQLPGKPTPEERWKAATEVTDFSQLYRQNCSGCHGAEGRLGAARPLNDPLYLALVSAATLHATIAQGVPGTSAPALAQQVGGPLTDKQIDILVEGMRSRWGKAENFNNVTFPPYSLQDASVKGSGPGDSQRGAVVYQTYCAQCHGKTGSGGQKAGSVIDPAYLALVSDQALRTTVIVGRSDLGMPDWRANISGQPMTPQEISDVVAWLASHRQANLLAQGSKGK
jgi:mono/diheme cytochrome c family protein